MRRVTFDSSVVGKLTVNRSAATRAGPTTTVRKWAKGKRPDFGTVYDYLLRLCRAEGKLVYEGPFDLSWRPDTFSLPWE